MSCGDDRLCFHSLLHLNGHFPHSPDESEQISEKRCGRHFNKWYWEIDAYKLNKSNIKLSKYSNYSK